MNIRSALVVLIGAVAVIVLAVVLVGGQGDVGGPSAAPNPIDPAGVDPSPVDDTRVYDPVRAGEEQPPGFRQLLPRDGIRPVYRPKFVAADIAAWEDDALVIGVEIAGEAKAYPVAYLNWREMVIDRLAGIPILVTW